MRRAKAWVLIVVLSGLVACENVVEPGNPVPSLTSSTPLELTAGSGPQTVVLHGTGFTGASRARVGGADRTTRFVSPTRLEVDLLAADVATPGALSLSVYNGPPQGGVSGTVMIGVVPVSVCGEAECTPVTAAYISHFQELDCTGPEAYYTAYFGYDGVRRSWNGTGTTGNTLRTLTHKSYRDNVGCYNQWPAGNTLPDFVRIYR